MRLGGEPALGLHVKMMQGRQLFSPNASECGGNCKMAWPSVGGAGGIVSLRVASGERRSAPQGEGKRVKQIAARVRGMSGKPAKKVSVKQRGEGENVLECRVVLIGFG